MKSSCRLWWGIREIYIGEMALKGKQDFFMGLLLRWVDCELDISM